MAWEIMYEIDLPPSIVLMHTCDDPRAGRLFVGGAGAVKVTTIAGTDVIFTGVVAGTVLPVRVKKVFSTGTTATNMVVMYSKYD